MSKRSRLLQFCSNLAKDRRGNFSIMAALAVPVLLASGGIAIDMTNMVMTKNQMQDVTDAAALAASSALVNQGLTVAEAKDLAKKFVKAQMSNFASLSAEELEEMNKALGNNTKVDITSKTALVGNAKTYVVDVSTKLDLPLNALTRLLGKDKAEIGTSSQSLSSTESKNAVSMYLVLDRSGSMEYDTATVNPDQPTENYTYDCSYYSGKKYVAKTCTGTRTNYVTKIEALRAAGNKLLTQLKAADPTTSLVRVGSVSYNNTMQTPSAIAWGTTPSTTYVNALTATGGTDSSGAFKTSYNSLMAKNAAGALAEEKAHKDMNGQVPRKYIVFMTDGENNYYGNKSNSNSGDSSDTETKTYCEKAKTDGITVFSIAFMAPDRGKTLLKSCATADTATEKYYFAAENADQLTAAFKYIGEKASKMTVRLTN